LEGEELEEEDLEHMDELPRIPESLLALNKWILTTKVHPLRLFEVLENIT